MSHGKMITWMYVNIRQTHLYILFLKGLTADKNIYAKNKILLPLFREHHLQRKQQIQHVFATFHAWTW